MPSAHCSLKFSQSRVFTSSTNAFLIAHPNPASLPSITSKSSVATLSYAKPYPAHPKSTSSTPNSPTASHYHPPAPEFSKAKLKSITLILYKLYCNTLCCFLYHLNQSLQLSAKKQKLPLFFDYAASKDQRSTCSLMNLC